MRVLAMAECASATLGRIVGRLPRWISKESAPSRKVVGIHVLLLDANGANFADAASVCQIWYRCSASAGVRRTRHM